MEELKNKLILLKELGVSYKFLSYLTNININTIYNFMSNKREISFEKQEKLNKYADILLSIKQI